MKIAIVGCGQIADGHVSELQKIKGLFVSAVCDRHELMARQLCKRFGIPNAYTEFSQMLESEKPDAVHITTPPMAHRDLALEAIGAGCHVVVEKPFGMNAAQAAEILDAAQKAGVLVTVGYTYYFDPPTMKLRKMISDGLLGDVVHVDSFMGYDLNGPFGKAIMSNPNHWVHLLPGKIFQNNLNHALHPYTEVIDDSYCEVSAFRIRRNEFAEFKDVRDEIDDELRVMLANRKTTGFLNFSASVRPGHKWARFYGTKNTATIDYVSRCVTLEPRVKYPTAFGRTLPPFSCARSHFSSGIENLRDFINYDFHYFAGFNRLFSLFYQSVKSSKAPPIPYNKILQDAQLMERIFNTAIRIGAPR